MLPMRDWNRFWKFPELLCTKSAPLSIRLATAFLSTFGRGGRLLARLVKVDPAVLRPSRTWLGSADLQNQIPHLESVLMYLFMS